MALQEELKTCFNELAPRVTIDELDYKIKLYTSQINALTGISSQQYQKRAALLTVKTSQKRNFKTD